MEAVAAIDPSNAVGPSATDAAVSTRKPVAAVAAVFSWQTVANLVDGDTMQLTLSSPSLAIRTHFFGFVLGRRHSLSLRLLLLPKLRLTLFDKQVKVYGLFKKNINFL